jgi:hypothetical protein
MIIQEQFRMKMIFLLVLSNFQLTITCKIKRCKFELKTEFKNRKTKQKMNKREKEEKPHLDLPAVAAHAAAHQTAQGPAPNRHPDSPRTPSLRIRARRTKRPSSSSLDAQELDTATPAPRPAVAAAVVDLQRTPTTL